MTERELERFWAKVELRGDGCWQWTASGSRGYGLMRMGPGRNRRPHLLAYEHYVGAVPEGLQLDHRCRNRACVNPDHMEPVTGRENVQRGARGRLVVACAHGHPYDERNTGWRRDSASAWARRYCKECKRQAERKRKRRLRSE